MVPTPNEILDAVKTFGPYGGCFFLFIVGLRFGWWHLDSEVKALLGAKDQVIASRDVIITTLTTELSRERELSDDAAKSVRETLEWAMAKARLK